MNTARTFQVCAKTDCSRFDRVGARVRAVASKVAIYVDTLAPAGGLDSTALDSIAKDRKSTRLNSSHQIISYAVFCLKKKKKGIIIKAKPPTLSRTQTPVWRLCF